MTNYDIIFEHNYFLSKNEAIKELSNALAKVCIKIINRLNQEQGGYIEISNFDETDIIDEFQYFFNKEVEQN